MLIVSCNYITSSFSLELFNDGRFVVAITKYDVSLSTQSLTRRHNRRTQTQRRPISEHTLQQTTQSFIADSIGIKPPLDIAIPVSAEWACLALNLQQDPVDEDIQAAKGIVAQFPDQLMQGQGETALPCNLSASLLKVSRIPTLEERYNSYYA